MTPFRCSNCKKLLGMIEGNAEIKCPKCKTMNTLDAEWRLKEQIRLHQIDENGFYINQ